MLVSPGAERHCVYCTVNPLLSDPPVPVLFPGLVYCNTYTDCSLHVVVSFNMPHFYRSDDACYVGSFPYLDSHVHLHG